MSTQMNSILAFFVGCVTFGLISLIKIPLKRLTRLVASEYAGTPQQEELIYHRLNLVIVVFVVLIAMMVYTVALMWLGEEHYKLCCALKGAVIAMGIYAGVDQVMPRI